MACVSAREKHARDMAFRALFRPTCLFDIARAPVLLFLIVINTYRASGHARGLATVVNVTNAIFRLCYFPKRVVERRCNDDFEEGEESQFTPKLLLSTMGKAVLKIIKNKLEDYTEESQVEFVIRLLERTRSGTTSHKSSRRVGTTRHKSREDQGCFPDQRPGRNRPSRRR